MFQVLSCILFTRAPHPTSQRLHQMLPIQVSPLILSYSHLDAGLFSPNIHLTLRVCQTEGEGNYLVASRDIAAGEVLITLLLHLGCIAKLNVLFFGLYMFVN